MSTKVANLREDIMQVASWLQNDPAKFAAAFAEDSRLAANFSKLVKNLFELAEETAQRGLDRARLEAGGEAEKKKRQ